jgi:hypothetical protein
MVKNLFKYPCNTHNFIYITFPIKIHVLIINNIQCSLKFILKVGVEESIVVAPRITDHGSAV